MKIIKFLRRFIFWSVSTAILLVLLLIFWLHYFFPSETVKKEICKFIDKTYGIQLSIKKLNVSLFSGITLEGFEFAPQQQEFDSLFAFKSLILSYKLLPLLDKKLVIDEITLESPSAQLIRSKDGRWNWQQLLDKFKKPPKPESVKPKSQSPALAFELDALRINNLSIGLADRQTLTFVHLQGFNFSIADFYFKDKNNYRGNIQLDFTKESPLLLRRPDLSLETVISEFLLKIQADPVKVKTSLKLAVLPDKISFKTMRPLSPGLISAEIEADYLQKSDSLIVQKSEFKAGDLVSFQALVNGSKLQKKERTIKLGKGELALDLDQIIDYLLKSNLVTAARLPGKIKQGSFTVSDIYLTANPLNEDYQLTAQLNCDLNDLNIIKDKLALSIGKIALAGKYRAGLHSKKLTLAELPTEVRIQNIALQKEKINLKLQQLVLNLDPVVKENFLPEQLQAKLDIINLNGCNIQDSLTVILPEKMQMPELLREIRVENRLAVNDFQPMNFIQPVPFNANIRLQNRFSLAAGNFTLQTTGELTDNRLTLQKKSYNLPSQDLNSLIAGSLRGFPDSLTLQKFDLKAGLFAELKIPEIVYRLKTRQAALRSLDLRVYPAQLLLAAGSIPADLKQYVEISDALLNINLNADLDLLHKTQRADGSLKLLLSAMTYNRDITLSGLDWSEKFSLLNQDIQAEGILKLGKADFKKQLSALGLADYRSEHKIELNAQKLLTIRRFTFAVQSLGAHLATLEGNVNLSNIFKGLNIRLENYLPLKSAYPFVRQIKNISGALRNKIVITADSANSIKIRQNHRLENISLTANLDSKGSQSVRVENLNLDLPVNLAYNLTEKRLLPWQKWPLLPADLLIYRQKRADYAKNGWPVKNLSIKKITVDQAKLKTTINNLESDLYFDNNRFLVNYFYLELLGGNIDGQLGVILPSKIDSTLKSNVQSSITLTASGLNTANLNLAANQISSSSSELNFSADFRLKGLDFIKNPEIDGVANITRIADSDAKALLEFLNKGSGDQTLDLLKNTLNLFPGIKLSLFSFTLKNNFIYTLIKLQKPWYLFYFPLAEEINPSKQSLRFYLDKYVKEK